MTNIEQEAIELTEFVKRYVPFGWKESIQTVCFDHYFMWYEMEAIKAWTQRKDAKKKAERKVGARGKAWERGRIAWRDKGNNAVNPYENSYSDEWLVWEYGWAEEADNQK